MGDKQYYSAALYLRPDHGWVVSLTQGHHEHPTQKQTSITQSQAETIARAIGDQIPEANPTPFEIVRAGGQYHKQAVAEALRRAEDEATKIPALRKQMEELG